MTRGKVAMTAQIDIDAYFQRITYHGPRTPTLDTLRALMVRHTEAIPFENLNPLLQWPVRLDLPSLEQKLVHNGRGGYCFEQNLLFHSILEALGFPVVGLSARVLWNVPEGKINPHTHMLLQVEVEGQTYIADVGFGSQSMTGPIRLVPDVEQSTPHEPLRLVQARDEFILQARIAGAWKPLYRFDLRQRYLIDYEVANWYVSTYPESIFVTGLRVANAAPGRRHTLLNNELAVHTVNGSTERRTLTSASELREALIEVFRINLPDVSELDAILEKMAAQPELAT